jgi:hypothetical protein
MWAQAINVVLGLWLMAAPAVLAYGRPAATWDHIVGPLIATFACIALWEATRAVRWANVPLAISLLAAPWLLDAPLEAKINSMLIGMLVALLSCVGGAFRHRFDGGWSMLWQRSPSGKDRVSPASLEK